MTCPFEQVEHGELHSGGATQLMGARTLVELTAAEHAVLLQDRQDQAQLLAGPLELPFEVVQSYERTGAGELQHRFEIEGFEGPPQLRALVVGDQLELIARPGSQGFARQQSVP